LDLLGAELVGRDEERDAATDQFDVKNCCRRSVGK
jgi:hypothetical protein